MAKWVTDLRLDVPQRGIVHGDALSIAAAEAELEAELPSAS